MGEEKRAKLTGDTVNQGPTVYKHIITTPCYPSVPIHVQGDPSLEKQAPRPLGVPHGYREDSLPAV